MSSGADRNSNASNVFSDFCQAWVARFPGSELPAAWEEDVRANLKKHKTKVAILKDELDKEEMYVAYLEKLLTDIERQRLLTKGRGPSSSSDKDEVDDPTSSTSKQEFLDRHLEDLQASTIKGDPFVTVISVSNVDKIVDAPAESTKSSTLPAVPSASSKPVVKTRHTRLPKTFVPRLVKAWLQQWPRPP